ncbi:MAG: glycosyltransferase [Gemmatimonadaceae bacterium]
MTPSLPFLSVIVPAHNAGSVLARCLEAIMESDLPRGCREVIVVDDGSTDRTATIAARYADAVVRLTGSPRGPAYARNRGFEAARGECLVFIDADICVHPKTLRRMAHIFATESDVAAAFGAYDRSPAGGSIVSDYRNLLHHYVHTRCAGEAETFWAGCGAVRRAAFVDAGMFDEWHYASPQIEDIELGHRLHAKGHRIVLRPELQGTHLKVWTLRQIITGDLRNRGVPWMRLLAQHRAVKSSRTLNLRTRERVSTALVGVALVMLALAIVAPQWLWLALAGAALVPVVGINAPLYLFFARERGAWFALCAIPLHFLYYLVSGVSVVVGYLLHETMGEPNPDPTVMAYSELGHRTWPPVPSRGRADAWRRDPGTPGTPGAPGTPGTSGAPGARAKQ